MINLNNRNQIGVSKGFSILKTRNILSRFGLAIIFGALFTIIVNQAIYILHHLPILTCLIKSIDLQSLPLYTQKKPSNLKFELFTAKKILLKFIE